MSCHLHRVISGWQVGTRLSRCCSSGFAASVSAVFQEQRGSWRRQWRAVAWWTKSVTPHSASAGRVSSTSTSLGPSSPSAARASSRRWLSTLSTIISQPTSPPFRTSMWRASCVTAATLWCCTWCATSWPSLGSLTSASTNSPGSLAKNLWSLSMRLCVGRSAPTAACASLRFPPLPPTTPLTFSSSTCKPENCWQKLYPRTITLCSRLTRDAVLRGWRWPASCMGRTILWAWWGSPPGRWWPPTPGWMTCAPASLHTWRWSTHKAVENGASVVLRCPGCWVVLFFSVAWYSCFSHVVFSFQLYLSFPSVF